jgi:hypothetical protein
VSRDADAAEKAMATHLQQLYRVYERVRDGMRAKPAINHVKSGATRRLSPGAS